MCTVLIWACCPVSSRCWTDCERRIVIKQRFQRCTALNIRYRLLGSNCIRLLCIPAKTLRKSSCFQQRSTRMPSVFWSKSSLLCSLGALKLVGVFQIWTLVCILVNKSCTRCASLSCNYRRTFPKPRISAVGRLWIVVWMCSLIASSVELTSFSGRNQFSGFEAHCIVFTVKQVILKYSMLCCFLIYFLFALSSYLKWINFDLLTL